MPVSLGAQPGAEDIGAEVTMVPRFTIPPGLTADRMVVLSGLTDLERRRAGAGTPLPGIAINRRGKPMLA